MKPSLQKLQKVFNLEAQKGFDNHAVIGGLERMLALWEAEARAEGVPEPLIELITLRLRDYGRLSPTSRQEVIQGILKRIQQEGEEAISLTEEEPAETTKAEAALEQIPPVERFEEHPPAKKEHTTAKEPGKGIAAGPPIALDAPITVLQGIGPRYATALGRLGLKTLGDMLYNFPRRYVDYSQLKPINRLRYGETVTVIGTIEEITTRQARNKEMTIIEALVSDGSGKLRLIWFNQPWKTKQLRKGLQVSLSGKVDQYLGRLIMSNPDWEQIEQQHLHTNRIVPIYPLTANIKQKWLRRVMHQVVSYWAPRLQDALPKNLRRNAKLLDLSTAIYQAHFPDSWEQLKAAQHRLAFDEIFYLQLGLLQQKRAWQERTARIFETDDEWLESQIARLPFALTSAQRRAIQDLRADLASGRPMNRLLQGDVGSGKTVVAALAIAMVVHQGAQAALMAPTSILAEQHYKNLKTLLCGEGKALEEGQIRLLVGATPEAEKRAILIGLASGEIRLLIGTHALIEEPVVFADLQLAIVDEQHRFGVEQRAALRRKGQNPHLLVMTATPIPRSLALTVYGDLDLTVLDEMPPGRQVVSTYLLTPRQREQAYSLIRKQIEAGHQAFIIYPLIEENNEDPEVKPGFSERSAVEGYQRLQAEVFPEFRLGLLHGRMKPDEKEEVMTRFRDGEIHILVSTSVVEVGVDVPNATVMLIEGANRFGLAQLHQFRGRVGRGADKSYCLLIPENEDAVENERLAAMVETNDGFVLAERDLEQRGPGDFLGTRQSGFEAFGQLRFARLSDVQLIEKARRFSQELFERDPQLELPEHQYIAAELKRLWGDGSGFGKGDVS
jgi:ATP-dependent DNA helicase RecG